MTSDGTLVGAVRPKDSNNFTPVAGGSDAGAYREAQLVESLCGAAASRPGGRLAAGSGASVYPVNVAVRAEGGVT